MGQTSFTTVYDCFLDKITDDMYMELTEEDTSKMLTGLLRNALPHFEFPRVDIYDFNLDHQTFNVELCLEEVNIIAVYMVVEWLGQQLASVENIRMKFSGSDFKFTSQANHMSKLQSLKKEYEREGFHLQRLYGRRKRVNGQVKSTFGEIMESSNKNRR